MCMQEDEDSLVIILWECVETNIWDPVSDDHMALMLELTHQKLEKVMKPLRWMSQ